MWPGFHLPFNPLCSSTTEKNTFVRLYSVVCLCINTKQKQQLARPDSVHPELKLSMRYVKQTDEHHVLTIHLLHILLDQSLLRNISSRKCRSMRKIYIICEICRIYTKFAKYALCAENTIYAYDTPLVVKMWLEDVV